MKPIILILLLVSDCASVTASSDLPVAWKVATVEFGSGDEAGSVRIARQNHAISELTLRWKGKDLTVPPSEFAKVPNPQLDTLQMQVGEFYGGIHNNAPYFVVELRFGPPSLGEHPRASFVFFSGAFRYLRVEAPKQRK
jgi:hypothetical protein